MSKPHDGGPAFPYKQPDRIDRVTGKPLANTERPVTVRDYFAVNALNVLTRQHCILQEDNKGIAILHSQPLVAAAYIIADEMLRERDLETPSVKVKVPDFAGFQKQMAKELHNATRVLVTREGKSHGKK